MTHETMKKIPSYLKGLVETRARADAYAQRLESVLQDIRVKLDKARGDREACDTLIHAYDTQLDPNSIEPVRAWRGTYGKRGVLTNEIREFVRAAFPAAVSTAEVAWHLIVKFEMDFITSEARDAWKKTSVRNRLRELAQRGEVERLELDGLDGVQSASWRWQVP